MSTKHENTEFDKLKMDVYTQMTDSQKNAFDPEVRLPVFEEQAVCEKKEYALVNREDTPENRKRREKCPSKLMQLIRNGEYDAAKKQIADQYYCSITAVSQNAKWKCEEKTARKILESMFDLVRYEPARGIHMAVAEEAVELGNEWCESARTLYRCSKPGGKLLDSMKRREFRLTYQTYLLAKKMILIECSDKKDYDNKVAKLHENTELMAVCAAASVLFANLEK